MLIAAMAHFGEGFNLGTLLMLMVEKASNLLSGYMRTNNIQNRTTVNFLLKTLIRNRAPNVVARNKEFYNANNSRLIHNYKKGWAEK
jgi:hypothetical protein